MNPRRRKRRLAYARARARAFVARGLRTDGQPRAPRKPCGCLFGSCLKCAQPGNKLITPAELVAEMWAAYQSGKSLAAVEREFQRPEKSVRQIFVRRGYSVRPFPHPKHDPVTGRIIPFTPAAPEKIRAAIAQLKFVSVPPELKQEWRRRPMPWRLRLLRQIIAAVKPRNLRPTTPFSKNVIPFDYGTPAAMALAARLNAGCTSQTKRVQIRPRSQGVIYAGRLWFWVAHTDGAAVGYLSGGKNHRRLLHHEIWESHHGRKIPAAHTVIFRDGNKNNLAPKNLALRSMADCARLNAWHHRLPPAAQKAVLEKIQAGRAATMARKSRRQTAALIGGGGLLAALKNRTPL